MSRWTLVVGVGLILVAVAIGSWSTIQAIENVAPRIHPTITLRIPMVHSYSTPVSNPSGTAHSTVTTTGAPGQPASEVLTEHLEAIRLWHVANP